MPSDDRDTEYSVFDEDDSTDDDGSTESDGDDPAPAGDRRRSGQPDPDETLEAVHQRGCPKCGTEETETDEIATTGTGFSKFFDIQNRRFLIISCVECGYSEMYKGQSKHNAVDFFLG